MTPYFERGGMTIYLGDCRDVLPQLEAVDHVLTDPPYARDVYQRLGMPNTKPGSGTPGRLGSSLRLADHHDAASRARSDRRDSAYRSPAEKDAAKANGTLKLGIKNHQYSSVSVEKLAAGAIGSIDEMLEAVAAEIARLTRRWSLVFSDVETCHRWRSELEGAGMRYVRTGAWVKTDPMPQFSGDRPAVGFEPCTITHAKGPMRWNGGGHAAVWTYGTVKSDRPDHPCPKPLSLMRELVSLFTDPGETICDPFMGSGTTLRAAMDLGRKCIGIEISEAFCEVAAKRLDQQVLPIWA